MVDDAGRRAVKDKIFEAYTALWILLSASPGEYSDVTKQLMMQFLMGNDQYSKTPNAAVDILVNHKSANKSAKAKSEKSKSSKTYAKPSSSKKKTETSFAQRGKQTTQWPCNCCGEMGHEMIDFTRYATTLPNKWFNPPGTFGQKKGP